MTGSVGTIVNSRPLHEGKAIPVRRRSRDIREFIILISDKRKADENQIIEFWIFQAHSSDG
jgi:hypothetical protein